MVHQKSLDVTVLTSPLFNFAAVKDTEERAAACLVGRWLCLNK